MDSGQRRLVATMRLHAITSTYGEEGLRERFAAEIASFPDAGQDRLNRALELAARLHAGDRRERGPYVNHLLRGAIPVMSHYGVHDPDLGVAPPLHHPVGEHPPQLAPRPPRGGNADGHARAPSRA